MKLLNTLAYKLNLYTPTANEARLLTQELLLKTLLKKSNSAIRKATMNNMSWCLVECYPSHLEDTTNKKYLDYFTSKGYKVYNQMDDNYKISWEVTIR